MASFATSYIPTTTSAATRAADVASISGSNFSSWYRQDEGTVFTDAYRKDIVPSSDYPHVFYASNGSTNSDNIVIGYLTETLVGAAVRIGYANSAVLYPGGISGVRRRETAAAFKANDFYAICNGDTANAKSSNSGLMPSNLTVLGIGKAPEITGYPLNGTIRRLTYWPQRLPNATLQTITL